MKLKDMKCSASGAQVVYRAPAIDRKGQSHYEVTVTGPKGAVDKALREADLTFDIDPVATEKDVNQRIMELLKPWHREMAQRAMDPASLKPVRPPREAAVTPARTITVAIRPTADHGTFFVFDTVFPVFLPVFPLFQVVFPPCSFGGVASFPVAGNPNVRIRFNSPFPPNAAASAFPGLATDVATFTLAPWMLVSPFNQFPVAVPSVARLMCWGGSLLPF
jgi:hypothetical protein